jgi:hypothetical protein
MSTLFVFYNINGIHTWKYDSKKFPKGWKWTGSGSTGKTKYPREEQFDGPKEGRDKMKKYLDSFFKKLKTKKIVSNYKIRNSYLP